jgi:hypothetical protein
MITLFDVLTVACFCGLMLAFFLWTERDTRTLMHLLIPALAFAVANQLGNAGQAVLALLLVIFGAGYAVLTISGKR